MAKSHRSAWLSGPQAWLAPVLGHSTRDLDRESKGQEGLGINVFGGGN